MLPGARTQWMFLTAFMAMQSAQSFDHTEPRDEALARWSVSSEDDLQTESLLSSAIQMGDENAGEGLGPVWKRGSPHVNSPDAKPDAKQHAGVEPFISKLEACAVLAALVMLVSTGLCLAWPVSENHDDSHDLKKFRRTYLIVWTVAIGTDWLQGPYVYALYQQFGFKHDDIATLYLAGFLTASIMGLVMGPITDRFGRRRFALVYCVLTSLQCVTKHFASYGMLFVGRFLGGMASCLLFTAFESWMVAETTKRGFSDQALKYTFGMKELLSSVMAIAAGLIAQVAACGFGSQPTPLITPFPGTSFRLGGYCTPFDVVIVACAVCGVLTQLWWTENYGSSENVCTGFTRALAVLREPAVLLIGLVVCLFESSMFLWVFIWTPSLTKTGVKEPPYALLFACFMAAKMVGSQIFTFFSTLMHTSTILLLGMLTGCLSHIMAFVLVHNVKGLPETSPQVRASLWMLFACFVLFEVAVGIYWPAAGMLKAQIVPESCRATMYNLYRLPLNMIVFVSLIFIDRAEATLMVTGILLGLAMIFSGGLRILLEAPSSASKPLLAADPEYVGRT